MIGDEVATSHQRATHSHHKGKYANKTTALLRQNTPVALINKASSLHLAQQGATIRLTTNHPQDHDVLYLNIESLATCKPRHPTRTKTFPKQGKIRSLGKYQKRITIRTTEGKAMLLLKPVKPHTDTDRITYPIIPVETRADRDAHLGHIDEIDEDNPYTKDARSLHNRIARALQVKAWLGWYRPKHYHKLAFFGRKFPNSYQLPGYYYKPLLTSKSSNSSGKKKHQDAFRRQFEGWDDDRFLDPVDGRIRKLFVQTIDEIYDCPNDTSWRRTYIRNISPWLLRVAWWPYSHMPATNSKHVHRHRHTVKSRVDTLKSKVGHWDFGQWAQMSLYWLPTCIGLLCLMCGPTNVGGNVVNSGFYHPVPYRYWSYPKSARNFFENIGSRSGEMSHRKDVRLKERQLLPRYLNFLDCQDESPRGRLEPKKWMKRHGNRKQPNYIFISYTAEKQFERPCKDVREKLITDCRCTTCEQSRSDADVLHAIARLAAEQAGVVAYWTDQNCMGSTKAELSEDVYAISDVTRNAHRICIVVGRTGGDNTPADTDTLTLLKEWGSRMWTWPEVLLGPVKEKLYVYTRGLDLTQPWKVSKLNFADHIWDDSFVARQLIDSYEGTMTLSRLELVILALESLKVRVEHGTTKYFEGDLSYALMGLLRQRPNVVDDDTAFQAFARLSLANDSDRLLERMIALLPISTSTDVQPSLNQGRRHYWTNMNDYWGAKLWDIEPTCQVAGIAANDTVILDGAHGATIHWDVFQRIAITTRETWSRAMARIAIRMTPGWLLIGIILVATSPPPSQGFSTSAFIGALFLIPALILVFLLPMLILHLYSGKVWNSQPWLLGFEGHLDIKEIEKKIWGFPCGRLSWAPYGSSLSKHKMNTDFLDDECEGTDPLLADHGTMNYPRAVPAGEDEGEPMRQFTIVDTFTMTVAMCSAARPPVVALLCGSEGGMQRAVMCSYDWTSQTFYRETVLRMETRVLERMPRIGRARFGLRRFRDNLVKVESRLIPP